MLHARPPSSGKEEQRSVTQIYLRRVAARSPLWAAVLEKEDQRNGLVGKPANDFEFLMDAEPERQTIIWPVVFAILGGIVLSALVVLGLRFLA